MGLAVGAVAIFPCAAGLCSSSFSTSLVSENVLYDYSPIEVSLVY